VGLRKSSPQVGAVGVLSRGRPSDWDPAVQQARNYRTDLGVRMEAVRFLLPRGHGHEHALGTSH
jgi:hypothetical protein